MLYELVWLRLSMAHFGVTTAMVSIVLSVFMAGLGLGSWLSGRILRRTEKLPALRLYGITELLIGLSAIVVPYLLLLGRRILESFGMSSSFGYYAVAGVWVAATMVPWCTLMGITVPVAMRAIAQTLPAETKRSFSYLYMSNVAGAVAGTTVPLFLIEILGFHGTLRVGALCNALIAVCAFFISSRKAIRPVPVSAPSVSASTASAQDRNTLALLFLSGLTCMAMEVVWVRRYTPYVGTMVYAFATILAVYLLATFIGSVVYRRWSARRTQESPVIWIWLATFALLPLLAAGPNTDLDPLIRLLLGLMPFTGLLGFITPMLVDRYSGGDPSKAGVGYAVNVAGCILGPLLAGFVLLPFISERWALILLTAPWLLLGIAPLRRSSQSTTRQRITIYAALAIAAMLIAAGKGYDENYPGRKVLRDYTATVIATGTGMDKQLLVNGYGMTSLTPITKVMAHLPLALLDRQPQDALVICFGMGTTFRSLHSWGIPVTVAELVPSVPRLFDYYHADGLQVLASPLSHVIVDDGRRYLERTSGQFDVITIDPPPPVEAAGSSLLYSLEFYRAARRRLRSGGILQQWLPSDVTDAETTAAVARSFRNSFPYTRTLRDDFGYHFLGSDQPISKRSAEELEKRMPQSAVSDFVEWAGPSNDTPAVVATNQFRALIDHEISVDQLITAAPGTPALTDDRPINEYFALRRWLHHGDLSLLSGDQ